MHYNLSLSELIVFLGQHERYHYDFIIGNMEGFVTLLFINVEGQHLADWGILMCIFQKTIYFQNSKLL